MRIVAGRFRGKQLAAPDPDDRTIRPSSDRLREAVFNILAHASDGDAVRDARVLDLFAGTGALGLEALSRGARFCVFIEEAAGARALIRRNVEAMGLTGATKIFRRDATRIGAAGTLEPFALIFADPPYGQGLAERALAAARNGGWLKPGAIVVVEERAGSTFTVPEGFKEFDRRTYGEGMVIFLRFVDADPT